ncbi:MAG: hypothetical protein INR62_03260 [Rhodospirillales bacterium]|nr:hypothetical protein [Acetobacter sp.]
MKELWRTADAYFRLFEGFRLGWRGWSLFGLSVAFLSAFFCWTTWRLLGSVFSGHPYSQWKSFGLVGASELATVLPFLVVAHRREQRLREELKQRYPTQPFERSWQARPLELARITGKPAQEFFPLAKDLIGMSNAHRACGWSNAFNANDLFGLLFQETSKSRIPGLLAILVAALVGLVVIRQSTVSDTDALISAQGQKVFWHDLYLPMLLLALVSWGSVYMLWKVGRSILANAFCHMGKIAEGNEDVINYFIADLLRFHQNGFAETPQPVLAIPLSHSPATTEQSALLLPELDTLPVETKP